MKTYKLFLVSLLSVIFFSASGQKATGVPDLKTESIKVWGNCGMCKNKIQHAAKLSGATSADWNEQTKILTVKYNPQITSGLKIQQSIAETGYDTKDLSAPAKVYNDLPGCCQYERKAIVQSKAEKCCDEFNCGADMTCCKEMKNNTEKNCCKTSDKTPSTEVNNR
jgi:hypothetical protein